MYKKDKVFLSETDHRDASSSPLLQLPVPCYGVGSGFVVGPAKGSHLTQPPTLTCCRTGSKFLCPQASVPTSVTWGNSTHSADRPTEDHMR